ncbi:MAG: holo-ACP synthase [Chloroflexi bacterium]|nr:holo-ACP synthase [Chloroflexota bacterium]
MNAKAAEELELDELVAQFWKIDRSEIHDGLAFDSTHLRAMSSLRFYRFLVALEDHFGVKLNDPASIITYGVLRAAIAAARVQAGDSPQAGAVGLGAVGWGLGNQKAVGSRQSAVCSPSSAQPEPVEGPALILSLSKDPPLILSLSKDPASPQPPAHGPTSWDGISIGHDIEAIANFPDVQGASLDSFYTRYFTPAEIARCAQSSNPRQHFAARFCAKEALRKCGALFRELALTDIEVVNDAAGSPSIVIHDERTNQLLGPSAVLLTLSHTDTLASAMVLVVRSAP